MVDSSCSIVPLRIFSSVEWWRKSVWMTSLQNIFCCFSVFKPELHVFAWSTARFEFSRPRKEEMFMQETEPPRAEKQCSWMCKQSMQFHFWREKQNPTLGQQESLKKTAGQPLKFWQKENSSHSFMQLNFPQTRHNISQVLLSICQHNGS